MSDFAEENQENMLKWVVRYVLIPISLAMITGLFALEVIDREIDSRSQQPEEDFASVIFATMTAAAVQNQPEETATPIPTSTAALAPTATEEAQAEETPGFEADTNKIAPGNTAVCGLVPAGWQLYTVQPGNTLYSLARQSGATIAAIRDANCLYGQLMAYSQLWLPPIYLDEVIEVTAEPIVTITATITVTELFAQPDLINFTGDWPWIEEECGSSVEECTSSVFLAISNIGEADAGPFAITVRLDPEQSVVLTQSFAGLAAGDLLDFSLRSPIGHSCYDPDCTVCVTVDSRGSVAEESEANNVYCTTFADPYGGRG